MGPLKTVSFHGPARTAGDSAASVPLVSAATSAPSFHRDGRARTHAHTPVCLPTSRAALRRGPVAAVALVRYLPFYCGTAYIYIYIYI